MLSIAHMRIFAIKNVVLDFGKVLLSKLHSEPPPTWCATSTVIAVAHIFGEKKNLSPFEYYITII